MLNNLVESKVAVQKNRKITENSSLDFIRKNKFLTPLETKVEKGRTYDTSFEKL
jgi:hypothetical protein